MKNLFKSKLVLSFLASSFVLATGLVGVRNMNSSYAMQSEAEVETKNDKELLEQFNTEKEKNADIVVEDEIDDEGDEIHFAKIKKASENSELNDYRKFKLFNAPYKVNLYNKNFYTICANPKCCGTPGSYLKFYGDNDNIYNKNLNDSNKHNWRFYTNYSWMPKKLENVYTGESSLFLTERDKKHLENFIINNKHIVLLFANDHIACVYAFGPDDEVTSDFDKKNFYVSPMFSNKLILANLGLVDLDDEMAKHIKQSRKNDKDFIFINNEIYLYNYENKTLYFVDEEFKKKYLTANEVDYLNKQIKSLCLKLQVKYTDF